MLEIPNTLDMSKNQILNPRWVKYMSTSGIFRHELRRFVVTVKPGVSKILGSVKKFIITRLFTI